MYADILLFKEYSIGLSSVEGATCDVLMCHYAEALLRDGSFAAIRRVSARLRSACCHPLAAFSKLSSSDCALPALCALCTTCLHCPHCPL